MPDATRLRSIEVDLAANTLRLVVTSDTMAVAGSRETVSATIDIGTGGTLLGVELPTGYIDVMPPEAGSAHLARSATAQVAIERDGRTGVPIAMVVPRRGEGYEITFPSGNQ